MSLLPIRVSVTVPLDRKGAFEIFTHRIGQWWPLTSKSLALSHAASCELEPRAGGRIYERTAEGAESVWGTITEWREPEQFVSSWHPGRHPDSAQMLKVSFISVSGGTRVELEHGGWEKAADRAAVLRERYESGWPGVLAEFEAKAKQKA